jgi:hypothetical protein
MMSGEKAMSIEAEKSWNDLTQGQPLTCSPKAAYVVGYDDGNRAGAAAQRQPSPCGVAGHKVADWESKIVHSYEQLTDKLVAEGWSYPGGQGDAHCSACAREAEKDKALRGLLEKWKSNVGYGWTNNWIKELESLLTTGTDTQLDSAGNYLVIEKRVQSAITEWSEKPHNRKWFKKVEGTPILNDLLVTITAALAAGPDTRGSTDAKTGGARD